MFKFTEAYSANVELKNSLIPKFWRYNDLLIADPARLTPKVFFCHSMGCKVSCHAPMCCDENCNSYGAKKI